MKTQQPTQDKIAEILAQHTIWLRDSRRGNRADLSRANLSGANLSGADLSGANLSGADLSGADLFRAHLSGANFSGANFSGANLSGANLSGANLSGADLSRANFSGADLFRATIKGIRLTGTVHVWTFGPVGSRNAMLTVIWSANAEFVFTGCFCGNVAEFEVAVNTTHGNNAHAKAYTAVIAAIRGLQAAYPQK